MVSTQEELDQLTYISKIANYGMRAGHLGRIARVLMDGGTIEFPQVEIEEESKE
jgi:hypothetical protein